MGFCILNESRMLSEECFEETESSMASGEYKDGISYYFYDEQGQTLLEKREGRYETSRTWTWKNGNVVNGYGGNDKGYTYTEYENKVNIHLNRLVRFEPSLIDTVISEGVAGGKPLIGPISKNAGYHFNDLK